jgi:predicted CoA-binding protein
VTDEHLREILERSPTVAVLGIHSDTEKAAFYVPEYLHDHGYHVIGVNPRFVGDELFGEKIHAQLRDIKDPVDLVDVFRRGEQVAAHVDDILAMQPRPKVVWLQLGVHSDEAAQRLEAEGIEVIQNRCTLADHKRLGLGKPSGS